MTRNARLQRSERGLRQLVRGEAMTKRELLIAVVLSAVLQNYNINLRKIVVINLKTVTLE